jgi:acetyl-CoA acyltransferase
MREAVIVEAVRTPLGRRNGGLKDVHPVTLLAKTLNELVERSGIDAGLIEDNITGCVSQVGEQALNVARNAWLAAGLPEHVPGTTVDRQCGSSQQAAHFAAQAVMSGAMDIVVASGVESMSRNPMGSSLSNGGFPFTKEMSDRYDGNLVGQGISSELIAAKWDLSREQVDAIGFRSQERAQQAWKDGRFDRETFAIKVGDNGSQSVVDRDEGLRETTMEKLGTLKPAFYDENYGKKFPQIRWVTTAGNSSQITDGAAALLIMTADKAKELGLKPRARFHTFAVAADDPVFMLTAPIPATKKALAKAGLNLGDIDVVEINEAFASVVLAWKKELGADESWFEQNVNPKGGAIALGHPLGGSGARLMTTLLHEMEDRGARYGLQTMCEGGGMANATILERIA